jgi:hypothetical protein
MISSLFIPGVIISESYQAPPPRVSDLPLEILANRNTLGTTPIALRLDGSSDSLGTYCRSDREILSSDSTGSLVQVESRGACQMPLITYKKKNYIIPSGGRIPGFWDLVDVSSDTLRNTLRANRYIHTEASTDGIELQEFFQNIQRILEARTEKFQMPIAGASLPTLDTYLPNSPRPYRADKTDGIHHGWDFYTREGENVLAIADGKIIHIKRDFNWQEMKSLHRGRSPQELQENLDVYRGNTVYLKTESGHVAIYAHLDAIPEDLTVGQKVAAGDVLGKVGDSAVPDKKYLYHLHFELAMNPFDDRKAGRYVFENVLLWSYFGKGKGVAWVRDNDHRIFEGNISLQAQATTQHIGHDEDHTDHDHGTL